MVTHDQAEAMTLADRIVVMNDRRIQQVGAPMEVYSRPANAFVARFVGSPAMVLAPVERIDGDGPVRVRLGDGAEVTTRISGEGLPGGGALQLGLRPEAVGVTAVDAGSTNGEVELVERLGDRTLVYAKLADGLELIALDEGNSQVKIGDRVGLKIDGGAAHLFDADGAGHHPEAAAA
jgi:multiple sugar transport system ATP-binding protein